MYARVKHDGCVISFYRMNERVMIVPSSPENKHRGLAGGLRVELLFNGIGVSFWEDEKVLEMDGTEGCTAVYLMPMKKWL